MGVVPPYKFISVTCSLVEFVREFIICRTSLYTDIVTIVAGSEFVSVLILVIEDGHRTAFLKFSVDRSIVDDLPRFEIHYLYVNRGPTTRLQYLSQIDLFRIYCSG